MKNNCSALQMLTSIKDYRTGNVNEKYTDVRYWNDEQFYYASEQ